MSDYQQLLNKVSTRQRKSMNNTQAQPPFVQPVPVNPIETLSAIYYDMQQAREKFLQTRELKFYQEAFKPGEQGSIDALITKLSERMAFIRQLQRIL